MFLYKYVWNQKFYVSYKIVHSRNVKGMLYFFEYLTLVYKQFYFWIYDISILDDNWITT